MSHNKINFMTFIWGLTSETLKLIEFAGNSWNNLGAKGDFRKIC